MLGPLLSLLICQLIGEIAARSLALPVPGPVIGLILLFALFVLRPAMADYVAPTTRTILSHLSLLFVPAGVGIVGNLQLLSQRWLAFAVILAGSTLIAMLASVLTFLAVQRLTRGEGGDD